MGLKQTTNYNFILSSKTILKKQTPIRISTSFKFNQIALVQLIDNFNSTRRGYSRLPE